MPGLFAVVGRTQAEADAKFAQLQALIEPKAGRALLGRMIGNFDLSGYPLDGPLPDLPETQDGQRSRQQLLTDLAQGENLTIRQLYERIAGAAGTSPWSARRSWWRIRCSSGLSRARRTASISWRRRCPVAWMISLSW